MKGSAFVCLCLVLCPERQALATDSPSELKVAYDLSSVGGSVTDPATAAVKSVGPYVLVNGNSVCRDGVKRDMAAQVEEKLKDKTTFSEALALARQCTDISAERFLGTTGDHVRVIVFFQGSTPPKLQFVEASRETQLANDLNTLLKLWLRGAAAGVADIDVLRRDFTLAKRRATLTLTVSDGSKSPAGHQAGETPKDQPAAVVKADAGAAARNAAAPPATADGQKATPAAPPAAAAPPQTLGAATKGTETGDQNATLKVVTGPPEHWYLSVDLPVNSVNQLKLDDSGQVQPVKEPSIFYAGLNFRLGDLFTTYMARPSELYKNLVLKALFRVSSNPLDSYGVMIGVRGEFFKRAGFDLSAFSPFVGWTFTKEDSAGQNGANAGRNSNFRFGLSFNIDKGVEWLKGATTTTAAAKKP